MIERSVVNMRRDLFRMFLGPLFKKVLSNALCTAWVGSTDETAVCALNFLKDRKIKVPRDISIVGFDGDLLGFENGITSYDFDFQNIGRQMIAFLFQPTSRAYFGKKQHLEMPGLPVLRDSTGRRGSVTISPRNL
jgi:DNA-binding LacI/PurR family transcriptional regulator